MIDEVNANGGVHGRPLELVLFDDQSSAAKARENVPAIAASESIAVLGHYLSSASLAAGPGYRGAKIPAVSGHASVDDLTADNPYYFRAVTPVSLQARSVAEYLRAVMKAPNVRLVHTRDSYGSSFAQGFSDAYPDDRQRLYGLSLEGGRIVGMDNMIDLLRSEPGPGVIVIGAAADHIADIVKAVRRRGIEMRIIAAQGAARESYLRDFADEPEEKDRPGFFSDNLYAVAPLIFDSAGAAAQTFAAAYANAAGSSPSWVAAGAHDAARLLIDALRRADDSGTMDRERLRAALAANDSPKTAVAGLAGRLYFSAGRDVVRPIRLGFFRQGRFVTAPLQLVRIEAPQTVDLAHERDEGNVVSFGDRHYWRQRVVYTGIDVNRLNRLDVKAATFNIDFNLWMRFAGDDEGQTHVEFASLIDGAAFDPSRPIQAGQEDGLSYRLYRISGDFKTRYDLHDYPFDTQTLLLQFRNTERRQELVTYVIDRFGLRVADEGDAVVEDDAYVALPLWRFVRLRYFVESLATGSTLGKAAMFQSGLKTEYAGFDAAIVLHRNSAIYILKNLLPLFLLMLVVFATMFFPATLFRERVTIPVTSILTSAVLLVAVSSQIGDVGYTIVVEKIFYAFFALCLLAMLSAFLHERLQQAHRERAGLWVDRVARAIYAVVVVSVAGLLYWNYAV